MAIQTNFPALKPTLLLDFANVKALDPRITFTRASEGRYYDGKTFAMAEQNLLLHSQDFTNTAWANTGTTDDANTDVAPDGTTTADRVTALNDASVGTTRIEQTNLNYTAGQTNTFSVFVKNGTVNYVQLFFATATHGSNAFANFDLTGAGALGTVGSAATASITASTNGFFRLTFSAPCTSSGTSGVFIQMIASATDARASSITRSGQTMVLWGAQLEQRSSVTAYTATTTQPITNYIPVLMTAAAGVARFDHNPTTEESLGLLIEEQRTNLLTYSEQFDNAAWTKTRSSISANATIAPDGTLTADKLIEDTSTNTHFCYPSVTISTGTSYALSFFAKAAERSVVQVVLGAGIFNNTYVNFDLSAGTVSATGTNVTSSITSVGNGWYRCELVSTSIANGTPYLGPQILLQNSPTAARSATYTGNGFSGIFIWGAQLEAGAFPTSYIPTVAAQVTRSADAASMTGSNFSSWYRQDEGTFFCNFFVGATSSAIRVPFHACKTTSSVGVQFAVNVNGSSSGFSIYDDTNTYQGTSPFPAVAANSSVLVAGAYKTNDSAASIVVNGSASAPVTDTSVTLPTSLTQLTIGVAQTNNLGNLNGHIRKIAFYPRRLTNSELQALTS